MFSFVKFNKKVGQLIIAATLAALGILLTSLIFLVSAILLCGYILFRDKTIAYRLVAIVFISFLFIIIGDTRYFRSFVLSCVYTPPAVTAENLILFNKFIEVVGKSDKTEKVTLDSNFLRVGDEVLPLDGSFYEEMAKGFFTESDIANVSEISQRLYKIKYVRFQKEYDLVLFYRRANRILSTRPGIVYSLNGKNPNEIDNEVINNAKPFTKITGNWYASRKLLLRGPRSDIPTSIPKSLFDHSLRIDGIDPNELHKFD